MTHATVAKRFASVAIDALTATVHICGGGDRLIGRGGRLGDSGGTRLMTTDSRTSARTVDRAARPLCSSDGASHPADACDAPCNRYDEIRGGEEWLVTGGAH